MHMRTTYIHHGPPCMPPQHPVLDILIIAILSCSPLELNPISFSHTSFSPIQLGLKFCCLISEFLQLVLECFLLEVLTAFHRVELSCDFQLTHACIHQLEWTNDACRAFVKEGHLKDWKVFHRLSLQSATLVMQSNVCNETCWICDALITGNNANTICTYLELT